MNEYLGLGAGAGDPMGQTRTTFARLTPEYLDVLFASSDLAETIVAAVVDDSLRGGVLWQASDDGVTEAVGAEADRLGLVERVRQLHVSARKHGGAALLLGLTGSPEWGVPPSVGAGLEWCRLVELPDVYPDWTALDVDGQPTHYHVSDTADGRLLHVHRDRLQLAYGPRMAPRFERQYLEGWGLSALQRVDQVLSQFEGGWLAATRMLADASEGVLTIDGLVDMIASGRTEELAARMALFDTYRSTSRTVTLDAGKNESYTKVSNNFSGVSDMLDRSMVRIAAAARMPVTRLFQRQPTGLQATGEADLQTWDQTVENYRTGALRPALLALAARVAVNVGHAGADVDVDFQPLRVPSELEELQIEKLQAEIDNVYIQSDTVSGADIGLSRWDDEGRFRRGVRITNRAALEAEARAWAPPGLDPLDPLGGPLDAAAIAKIQANAAAPPAKPFGGPPTPPSDTSDESEG